jgi:hypothetical protein
MATATRDDLMTTLIHAGEMFHGGRADEIAAEWADEFDDDFEAAVAWIEAGYWDAGAAVKLLDLGMSSGDTLAYRKGREKDHGYGIDPIYAICNGDASIDDLTW